MKSFNWNPAKLGAAAYALWGVMHIGIMFALLYKLKTGGGSEFVAFLGSSFAPEEFAGAYHKVLLGLFLQHAWNLGIFGALSLVIAFWNWRNESWAYWINLGLVSLADIGFLFAILLPGYIRLEQGIGGPMLWVIAAFFSSIAYFGKKARGDRS